MKKLLLSILILGICSLAQASVITIDFNDLSAGDVVTDQYSSSGVEFALLNTPAGYPAGPTAGAISGDVYDGASGMALIPGDDLNDPFYDMEIRFAQTIDFFSFSAYDSDEAFSAIAYLGDAEVATLNFSPGSNLQRYDIIFGEIGGAQLFDRVVLDITEGQQGSVLGGPEFFDNLSFNQTSAVPEPSTLILFGIGTLGLAGFSRKKN